jgi:glycosyltransferase involved in cell wall biosynthesis
MDSEWQPLVSVIVPVYNSQDHIVRCIKSITNQTYRNLQIIFIDDGSTDDSLDLLQDAAATDSRIQVVPKPNGGPSTARNMGMDLARGEWLHFHDSDDWMPPRAIEMMVDATRYDEVDMVVGSFYRVLGSRCQVMRKFTTGVISYVEYLNALAKRPANFYFAAFWNKLMRRSIFEDNHMRLDETIRFGEDHLLMLEYLMHIRKVFVLDEPIYYYLDRPGSLLHQGLTPLGIAKNKAAIYETYARTCRRAGIGDTLSGKLLVAAFLIAPATDGTVLPFARKLTDSDIPR